MVTSRFVVLLLLPLLEASCLETVTMLLQMPLQGELQILIEI